jgi:twinkle protein
VFYPDPHVKRGFTPNFKALQPDNPQATPKLEFRYGEVTVWAGYNFEGKSQMTKQVQLDAITQDERVLVLDLEQHPKITLGRMVRSITAQAFPAQAYIEKSLHWITDKIWLYDTSLNGVVTLDKLIELFTYAAKRFGITQFFLDSLMKLEDVPEDDINAQKKAINVMCEFARVHDTHVHVVAHFKKPSGFNRSLDIMNPPDRYEISGSGKFSDAAFNVILVHRNRFKEDVLSGKREPPEGHTVDYYRDKPDAMMNVDKQKNGESWSGFVKLWWDQESQQVLIAYGDKPRVYLKHHEKFK